jgi:hypothetical protein
MEDLGPENFEYILMPGKVPVAFQEVDYHNRLFAFWKEFWGEVLLEVTGERRRLSADDFLRQDRFALIAHNDQIVGIHAYSFFNIDSDAALDHSYFEKYFNGEFVQALRARKVHSVMTMEYFSVAKAWRGRRTGVSLAKVIVALGLRLARERKACGTITAARADVPAANIARKLGAISLVDPISVHGKPTELMLFPSEEIIESEDPKFKAYLDGLWYNRIDLTQNDVNLSSIKKIA